LVHVGSKRGQWKKAAKRASAGSSSFAPTLKWKLVSVGAVHAFVNPPWVAINCKRGPEGACSSVERVQLPRDNHFLEGIAQYP
jgi:hypothetical protein